MKVEFSRQIFVKQSNIKFHENPSSGSRVIPCGRTDRRTDRRTDMTKLTVAFRNFMNELKKLHLLLALLPMTNLAQKYMTTQSIIQATWHRMTGLLWIMNCKTCGISGTWPRLKLISDNCLESLRRAANRIQLLYVYVERAHKPLLFHTAWTLSPNSC